MQATPPSYRPPRPLGRHPILQSDLLDKFVRFGAVGILNTLIDYAVFIVSFQVFGLDPLAANTVAFMVAVNFGYVMNKKWTFRDDSRGRAAVTRGLLFLASYGVGFLAGSGILWLAALYIDPRIAKVASIGASLTVNFILSKTVVFRPR